MNRQITIEQIFDSLWQKYITENRQVAALHQQLLALGETIHNDHIALRGFSRTGFDLDRLSSFFLERGYVHGGNYHFEQKKLRACHLEPPRSELPKVFISELLLEQCSNELQKIVDPLLRQVDATGLQSPAMLWRGRAWTAISKSTYDQLLAESEYAAWVAVFGFRANHFTVSVNHLNGFKTLAELNAWVKVQGFTLNGVGGEIKGGARVQLAQSSTLADKVVVKLSDGDFELPCCFYEFAYRYPLADGGVFPGFITDNADKIFESTNLQNR